MTFHLDLTRRFLALGAALALAGTVTPQSYRVETSTSAQNGGTAYTFNLVFQTGSEPGAAVLNTNIWQWGFYLPLAPLPFDNVEVPDGWKWKHDAETGLFSFYTEGGDGWGTGDFGLATVPMGGSRGGFKLWSPFPPTDSVVQAFDVNWNQEHNLGSIPGAPSALVTLTLGGVTGSSDGILFRASWHRPGDAGSLNWSEIPLHGGKLRVPIYNDHPLELRVQGGTFLAKRIALPNQAGDHDLGTLVLLNGDVNGDNSVGIPDFLILRQAFGSQEGGDGYDARADLNRDGTVNILDFLLFRQNYGQSGEA
ncbi:MAG: hypothetical protein AMXMBFR81_23120 [Chthonomonas sp.]